MALKKIDLCLIIFRSIPSAPPAPPALDGIPEEYANLGVPVLPPDYVFPVPPIRDGYTGGEVTIGGVRGLHIARENMRHGIADMHIHGGGFTMCSAMTSDYLLYHFLDKTNVEQYAVEYCLAPYHKFPEPVEDCLSFYMGLREMGYERIIVGGESAGAGGHRISFSQDRNECDYIGGQLIIALKEMLKPYAKCYSANLHDSVNLLICLNHSNTAMKSRYDSLCGIIRDALSSVSGETGMTFQGSISPIFEGAENIPVNYRNTYDLNIYAQVTQTSGHILLTRDAAEQLTASLPIDTADLLGFYTEMQLWNFRAAQERIANALRFFMTRTIGGSRMVQSFLTTHLNNAFKTMLPSVPLEEQNAILDYVRSVYIDRRQSYLYETQEDARLLLADIFRMAEQTLMPLRDSVPDRMRFVSDEILRNYADPNLSINTLAEQLEMPQATLSNQFKQWSGITPIQHLQNTRIEAAKQHLVNVSLSIADVAHMVGYYSESSFIHTFKRLTGMSPGAFRTAHEKPKTFVPEAESEDAVQAKNM